MFSQKQVRFLFAGSFCALALYVGIQQTDTASKDKEQLELVVRDVVRSEMEKQKAEWQKMMKTAARDAVKESIAFIDAGSILPKMPQFEDIKVTVQSEFNEEQKELNSIGTTLAKLQKEISEMGGAMSKQALDKKQEEMASLQAKGQLKANNMQEKYARKEQEAQVELLKEIQTAASEVAMKENRIAVLAGGLAFADPVIDLSEKVLAQSTKNYEQKKKKLAMAPAKDAKPVAMAAVTAPVVKPAIKAS
jgi:Skp family chaperone for outer membrane proteins